MIVDTIWKSTNVARVRLAPRSSQSQKQATFPDNVIFFFENLVHYNAEQTCTWMELFSRVGLVQTALWGRLLNTTMIDLMWSIQAP
jgi:hypothetical protein